MFFLQMNNHQSELITSSVHYGIKYREDFVEYMPEKIRVFFLFNN